MPIEHDSYLVENWDTETLIDFLKEQNLKLEEKHYDILRKEEITGQDFLDMTEEKFRSYGLKGGPAMRLAKKVQALKKKPKRAFSSYKSLSEVLAKYNLVSEGTEIIPLFIPQTYEIKEDNKHFLLCMADINLRLQSYGTLMMTSLESMRNEYVSTILHTALRIAEDATNKKFSMKPEYEIIGDESCGRVDYAIKDEESLICITEDKVQQKLTEGFAQNIKQLESSYETNKRKRKRDDDYFDYLYRIVTSARDWHFLLYSPGEILQASKAPFSIEFVEESLVENSEEYQTLHKGVRKVLGIIVGLLKDRACAEEEPERKRVRKNQTNAEFKAKYDEAKDEITKLRAELRNRIEELEKARIDTIAENTRCDVENTRRDAENAELKARVAKLEEDSRQPRKDSSPAKSVDILDSIVANETVSANSKSSEEKIMDSFLDEVSVDKRMLRKKIQKKQKEKFIQEVSKDDSIPSVSSQRGSDLSTNYSNIIDEPGLNSLDVYLEKTIRNCDPLAVEMGMPTFSLLYEKLCDAVTLADRVTQEAIFCYCQFGKALIQRRGEIVSEKQVDLESNTVSRILNIEVKAQLPADTSDTLLWKRIEQAKKLYTLFNAIDNIPFDYSIHMETQLCELSSQSDKKNSDLSHITSSDVPTESQIPNQSALKKFNTKLWSSPCPICNGKHGNYGLHGSWYRENGNQLPYDPELAKLYSQDKLEYCLTCNTSSNKLKFATVA
ncbi:hypothetical protein RclHR1_23620003 [Rhizophagus clarus]|uniref:SAM domain-containing protein n=1 Tax=Rhizophagus clarus TaxID=94130 RepID=A0A2Z6RC05_9GLOM|nr:hypothetical protein RclHR1_23620003 [Rhizophagus clarus]